MPFIRVFIKALSESSLEKWASAAYVRRENGSLPLYSGMQRKKFCGILSLKSLISTTVRRIQ